MVLTISARPVGPALRRDSGGRASAAAAEAALSSAWARVVPQWQAGARPGTRRPQVGHDHVWEAASTTAPS